MPQIELAYHLKEHGILLAEPCVVDLEKSDIKIISEDFNTNVFEFNIF